MDESYFLIECSLFQVENNIFCFDLEQFYCCSSSKPEH